jgi:4-oxalomesaconate tautomerase
VCASLLPTGRVRDEMGGLAVTCIDNGMPMVLIRAKDLDRSGYETVVELNADDELKGRLEKVRLEAGQRMGLGDVTANTYPKMCLLAPPRDGGSIATRTFIPHVCHDAIGVLAAVTVATACVLEGSIANELAAMPNGTVKTVSVEHPSGEFSVELEVDPADPQKVTRAALLRTARLLMRGEVFVPASIWEGSAK